MLLDISGVLKWPPRTRTTGQSKSTWSVGQWFQRERLHTVNSLRYIIGFKLMRITRPSQKRRERIGNDSWQHSSNFPKPFVNPGRAARWDAYRCGLVCILAEEGHTITCKPDSRLYVCVYRPRRDCTPSHVNLAQLCLCIYRNVAVYIQKC